MVEVSTFDARSSVAALLQAHQAERREPIEKSTNSGEAKPTQGVGVPESHAFRFASVTHASTFSVDLTATGKATSDVGEVLSGTFEELLGIFHGASKVGAQVEKALSSVADLIDRASEGADVVGVQVRVASVVRTFGAEGGNGATFGSVSSFAIEVGLVRGDRVNAEDVAVLGFEGEKCDLSVEQRRTGVANAIYRVQDNTLFGDELAAAEGQNKAQAEALQIAIERLRLVQDALAAFRKGDTRALEDVERLFRSGTLDAGAVRAISQGRGSDEAVVPGSGVVGLR